MTIGYQSAPKGTEATGDEGGLMWEIVKVVAEDEQMRSWAEDQGRADGVSKFLKT